MILKFKTFPHPLPKFGTLCLCICPTTSVYEHGGYQLAEPIEIDGQTEWVTGKQQIPVTVLFWAELPQPPVG